MTKATGADTRLATARALLGVLDGPGPEPEDAGDALEHRDRAFARHLEYGVLRWLGALEWLAGRLLRKPLKHRDADVRMLLLIGLFQLWKGGTAPHAAVHETVEAARALGKPWACGLLNGVLRNFQRQREALLAALAEVPDHHAHPDWLLQVLQADWPKQWRRIVEENNRPPPMWLRVNSGRVDRESYLSGLRQAGLGGAAGDTASDSVLLDSPVGVEALPGFSEGLVSVQDAAAQLAADLLGTLNGQRVLDACAAPGGKTCHLLERNPGAQIVALDSDPARIRLIEDNFQRLGVACPAIVADAAEPGGWWDGVPYDRILLDAPCSATGVIRRHPEIKWLRSPAQVSRAVSQQRRLLEALWPLLVPGGMLVYATCSVLKCENSEQIQAFLSRHPDAALLPEPGPIPPGGQILPGDRGMDGFFYACLRKSA